MSTKKINLPEDISSLSHNFKYAQFYVQTFTEPILNLRLQLPSASFNLWLKRAHTHCPHATLNQQNASTAQQQLSTAINYAAMQYVYAAVTADFWRRAVVLQRPQYWNAYAWLIVCATACHTFVAKRVQSIANCLSQLWRAYTTIVYVCMYMCPGVCARLTYGSAQSKEAVVGQPMEAALIVHAPH